MAKKVILVMRHDRKKWKSSIHKDIKRDANLTIAPVGTIPNPSKGIHLSEEDFKNLLHNLDPEWEKYIRFVSSKKDIKAYVEGEVIDVEDAKDALVVEEDETQEEPEVDNGQEQDEAPEVQEETTEEVEALVIPELLLKAHTEMNDEELYEYRKELKEYAKSQDIKVAPATKNVEKIKAKILEGLNKK